MGHGGVDVRRESIGEETIKRCVCDGEIHIWMKQTSIEIIKQIFLEVRGRAWCGMGDSQLHQNILLLGVDSNPHS